MKVQDLTESKAQPLANKLFGMMKSAKADLESQQTDNSTHPIGGNFHAHVSGEVEIRTPYTQHGQYGSINWSAALLIGNNIPDALNKSKEVYEKLVAAATADGAEITAQHDGSITHFKVDDGTISLAYDYARNFCTVKLRLG